MSTETEFEDLYRTHHRTVLSYCARRAASPADAWDAASEVFVVAWRRFEGVPADHERAWLLGVAHKVLANQRRAAGRVRRLQLRRTRDSGEFTTADEPLLRDEETKKVLAALSNLKPLDREILQLALWEELPPIEVASVLGISRAAVDQRLSRAKRRLANRFEKESKISGNATPATQEGGVR